MGKDILLEINKLSAGYGKSQILFDIDLTIQKNEMVALIGPNGAGKSTIIKSIFNLTNIYSGEIKFKGENIVGLKTSNLIKKKIVYLNQGKVVFPNLTIGENLELAGNVVSSKKEIQKKLEKVFALFPILAKKKSELAITLSGGQQQQLALGRALIQEPEILLLDEPTLGLNPILQKELFATLANLKKENLAFLIVEQNARSAITLADTTCLLENGQIKLIGGKEIIKHPMIKKVYLGG